ncbi:DUF4252 domain-containing protein [Antarcticibacterium sp. 1MA-6-2]|uniref:DUF4252 domain-containing protein n=1 Tax=Antarcticibacterium sp. 1MA-6-2 TaxID=2908210 RepID=UPI001F1AD153|nr:DUF4252 domain-containing protein [Antarcticibacterium sp. 1MA-6-2]UJH91959.1 DUF4252 domain-containing protein [Antarcticibacterium sp. 1MA-6-2]
MRLLKSIGVAFLVTWMISCDNQQTLQEYYVDNQESKDFVAFDIPASMFANAESLDLEQREILETVKKINILAIPKKDANTETIEVEKNNLFNILKEEKYQLLMRYGGGTSRMEIYFTSEEEAVDEVIIYGFDDSKGMGIARLLGKDMNPGDIMQLVRSLQEGDLNLEAFSGVKEIFASTGGAEEETQEIEETDGKE